MSGMSDDASPEQRRGRRFILLEGPPLGFWLDQEDRLFEIPIGWDPFWKSRSLEELKSWALAHGYLLTEPKGAKVIRLADFQFDPKTRARKTDPITSKLAALANLPARGKHRWRILWMHFLHPLGLFDEELMELLRPIYPETCYDGLTPRRGEITGGTKWTLKSQWPLSPEQEALRTSLGGYWPQGWLEDSGLKKVSSQGRPVIVWRITPRGLAEFAPEAKEGIEIDMP